MKKKILILILAVMMLSLAACQATPTKAVAVLKDSERMIEIAQAETTGVSEEDDADISPTNGNTNYVKFFHGTTDAFTVNIDAALEVPTASVFPILRVTAKEFDEGIANRFYRLLCDGTDLYTQEQFETKEVIGQKIAEAKQMIKNGEDTDGYIKGSYLQELEEAYQNASDVVGQPADTVTLTEQGDGGDGGRQFLVYSAYPLSQPFRGRYFSVKTGRANGSGYLSESAMSYFDNTVYPVSDPVLVADVTGLTTAREGCNLSMTPMEAQRQAEQLLLDAGVVDMQVSAVYLVWNVYQFDPGSDPATGWVTDASDAEYTYRVMFQRVAQGIPVISPTIWYSVVGDSEQAGSSEWRYERLYVDLNEQGISSVYWMAPMNIGEVVVEDSTLLPFSDISDIFETMICAKNETYVTQKDTYHMATDTIDVSKITLSLQRISEADSVTTGLLVPVWNFWGSETRVYEDGTTVVCGNDIGNNTEAVSLLSINAVDGSVIDPELGY